MDADTQGDRIRSLFESTSGEIAVIAPFIKVNALRSLLDFIPVTRHLRCVSRWHPKDIAAGVSDPEILDLLEERGNYSLSLVDSLHAKLYVAGDRCLAGSANVTNAGLGEGGNGGNIEVLVESTIDDPGIAATLEAIAQAERVATFSMARMARHLADKLDASATMEDTTDANWFPRSRSPERVYGLYAVPPNDFVGAADSVLLADLARSNLPPGLEKREFDDEIRSLLAAMPPAKILLETSEDMTLTRADASSWFDTFAGDDFSTNDLWIAFINWMAFFYPDRVMKQEVAEVALRNAQLIG